MTETTRSPARTKAIRAAKYTGAALLRCGQVLLIVVGALASSPRKSSGSGGDDGD
ncbi:hypothetical protein ABZY90_33975 [Streptomyces sp. NPDC006422]|uniref:hypothetical protein n=1 Tax=unclassified Streptomyces TaxID=2593676 RepID=UPI0033A931BB